MKVKFVQDYTGIYGKAEKGRIDWVTNVAGKKLVKDGFCISIAEEKRTEELEIVTKNNPMPKLPIIVPIDKQTGEVKSKELQIRKFAQHTEKVTFWDKIKSLWQ